MKIRIILMFLLISSLVSAVEVKLGYQKVMLENEEKIFTIQGQDFVIETLTFNESSKSATIKIDGEPEVLDFSEKTGLYFDRNDGLRILFDGKDLFRENTPILSVIFISLPSEKIQINSLNDFPDSFNQFKLVVGENSDIDRVIAGMNLLRILGIVDDEKKAYTVNLDGDSVSIPIVPVGTLVLDADASLSNNNYLVVGGPCANQIAAELMGNPENCAEGFKDGQAIIRLFENNGFYSLLVAGYSAYDTQRAVEFLNTTIDTAEKSLVINTETLTVIEK